MKYNPRSFGLFLATASIASVCACSIDEAADANYSGWQENTQISNTTGSSDQSASDATPAREGQLESSRTRNATTENIQESLEVNFGHVSAQALSLTGNHTQNSSLNLNQMTSDKRYLRVNSQLKLADGTSGNMEDAGCILLELKDESSPNQVSWLRVSTSGIRAMDQSQALLPLEVKREEWRPVPNESDPLNWVSFEASADKRYDGKICFRIDFSEHPVASYSGSISIQYLVAAPEQDPFEDWDDDDLAPRADDYYCSTEPLILKAGESAKLSWDGRAATGGLGEIEIAASDIVDDDIGGNTSNQSDDYDDDDIIPGTVYWDDDDDVVYTAPTTVSTAQKVFITTQPDDDLALPSFCEVTLIPDDTFVIDDDGESQGWIGNVFVLDSDTRWLPDFDQMTAVSRVMLGNLDVPERRFSKGFPGVENLFEWFGIRFDSRIYVPEDCDCEFKLTADDGAILYIDGEEVIDNDGVHPTRSRTGGAQLEAGFHDIRVDYFQGPRYHITLQLLWKLSTDDPFTIIETSSFARP